MTRPGRRRFFAAGAAEYDDPEYLPLAGVVTDLSRMNALFEQQLSYELAEELDARTAETLRKGLAGEPGRTFRPEDTVVVYYSGHGTNANSRHYLVCEESARERPTATALATEDLVRILAERGARRLLLLIDTCWAGAGAGQAARSAAMEMAQRLEIYADRQLVAFSVISAARDYQRAYDCAFSEALAETVHGKACGGMLAERLQLETVVEHVGRKLRSRGQGQDVTHVTLLSDLQGEPFFPNPAFIPGAPEGVSVSHQDAWARTHPNGAPLPPSGRSAAVPPPPAGGRFVGRAAALEHLRAWVAAVDPPGTWLAVTGDPGTGKSALLAEFYRRFVDEPDRPDGAKSATWLFVDVRHRHLEDLLEQLAVAEGADPGIPPDQLLSILHSRTERFVLVVDGVEEAGSPDDTSEPARITRYLDVLTSLVRWMRVIGTASRDLVGKQPRPDVLDLDQLEEAGEGDLTAHAARLLTRPDGPGSTGGWSSDQADRAAPALVHKAQGNHLLLNLLARLTLAAPPPTDAAPPPTDAGPPPEPDGETAGVGGVFLDALKARCRDPDELRTTHALLTGLAFAPDAGLPWAGGLWPDTVSGLFHFPLPLEDDDVRRALDAAAPFVVEGLDATGRSVYRLYHESFAKELRDAAPPGTSDRMAQALAAERNADTRKSPDPPVAPSPPDHLPAGTGASDVLQPLTEHMWGQLVDGMPEMFDAPSAVVLIATPGTPEIVVTQDQRGSKEVTVRAAADKSLYVRQLRRQPPPP
ncbi:caspase family protein [Streptomyces sp. SD15]